MTKYLTRFARRIYRAVVDASRFIFSLLFLAAGIVLMISLYLAYRYPYDKA